MCLVSIESTSLLFLLIQNFLVNTQVSSVFYKSWKDFPFGFRTKESLRNKPKNQEIIVAVACCFVQKETLAQVFSCEVFKNPFLQNNSSGCFWNHSLQVLDFRFYHQYQIFGERFTCTTKDLRVQRKSTVLLWFCFTIIFSVLSRCFAFFTIMTEKRSSQMSPVDLTNCP